MVGDDNSKISSDMLTLRAHSGPVYSVCFSQDNSFMLSASEDLTGMNFMLKMIKVGALVYQHTLIHPYH